MRLFLISLVIAGLAASGAQAQTAYDLLFRPGTLSSMQGKPVTGVTLETGDAIVYDHSHSPTSKEAALNEKVRLTLIAPTEADLVLERGTQHRSLGRFPARVGNPMVMYFLEGVLKDISDETGGSPFYLRNRLKEALGKKAEAQPSSVDFNGRQVAALTVTMMPLANASERRKLGRFADLEVTVITSDAVPGGYLSFAASAPEAPGKTGGAYDSHIALQPPADAGEVVR